MRKILVLLLVFGLVLGCAGVVSAVDSLTINGPTTANVGTEVTFSVTKQDNVTYSWTINGTSASNGESIKKNFDSAGKYIVKVTASGTNVSASEGTKEITIKPVASISASKDSGNAPLNVTFTGGPASGVTYLWTFESGRTSTEANPSYSFTTAKDYSVTLVVTQNGIASETCTKKITVSAAPVAPAITSLTISPSVGVVSSPVQFTAVVTGDPTTYEWDFGDGNTQTGESPTIQHTYNVVKNYTAKLTVKNEKGNATKTVDVVVKDGGVSINTNVSSGKVPLTVNFTAVTNIEVVDDGFEWNLHPDATLKFGKSVTYTYTEPGEYTVTLQVTPKIGGDKIEKTVKITAKEDVLDASFTASTTSGAAPLAVKFTDTSSGATAWAWSIYKTDSGSRTLQKEFTDRNISYTFQNAGTYQVELIAKKDSHSDSETKEITVSAKATTAPTTKPTTKATTAPTTAATTSQAVKAAALSSDDNPVPNPMDIIEEFIRLIKVMLVPENYSLAI